METNVTPVELKEILINYQEKEPGSQQNKIKLHKKALNINYDYDCEVFKIISNG